MKYLLLISVLLSSACQQHKKIPNLPQAITNNAVALVKGGNGVELYSFNGLSAGKTWKDITKLGFRYAQGKWSTLTMPKDSFAVLASTAVSIGDKIYMIGGYTVAADHSEKSMPKIFQLATKTQQWSTVTTMPVPVDDTVALVYANRYIYLVSGWHDDDNVSVVQVYDTLDNRWFKATDYPAPAVFGHAGGIVGNTMVICDGVKVVSKEKSRDFVPSPICMKGTINLSQPNEITWQAIPHHSHTAYYRMAASGNKKGNEIVFVGGSDNPYNYDGIGYDGIASSASSLVFSYDLTSNSWRQYVTEIPENMDHRALLSFDKWFYIIGGMENQQKVSDRVIIFKLNKK